MDTIYDRLGDLLRETLEAGEVKFVKVDSSASERFGQEDSPDSDDKVQPGSAKRNSEKKNFMNTGNIPEYHVNNETGTVYHMADACKINQTIYEPKQFVQKKLTPEVVQAYKVLEISTDCSLDEIKRAYKDKIKYFHPDRYSGNPVLLKIATEKTRQLVDAYKVISMFLEF